MSVGLKLRAQLIDEAQKVLENSYSPYSKFSVGAALMTGKGNIFRGVNVENISYGLTCCAERSAVFSAISYEGPHMKIKAIAVATAAKIHATPCGACRQVLSEFGSQATLFFYDGDEYVDTTVGELLPYSFKELVDTDGVIRSTRFGT